jgi:hypothetical protein
MRDARSKTISPGGVAEKGEVKIVVTETNAEGA